MKKLRNKGFTLIELLVVIAIIGILSSIVLASLSTARNKGNAAKVQGQLASARNAAEIYYGNVGSYGIVVTGTSGGANSSCATGMWADTTSGMSNLGNIASYPAGTKLYCDAYAASGSSTQFVMEGSLDGSTGASWWCVDSSGKSTATSTAPTTNHAC